MKIISTILAFILGFFTYPISFLPFVQDTDFDIKLSEPVDKSFYVEGTDVSFDAETTDDYGIILNNTVTLEINKNEYPWFNYYGIAYSADAYIKGEICYRAGVKKVTEEFFLEPSEDVTQFHSFINNALKGTKAITLISLSFTPLNAENATIYIHGISLFNRNIPDKQIYIENDSLKIGVDLLWGGALSYFEDLDSNVQVVEVDGNIYVDSNAAERYNTKSVNDNVNLINRNDTGRLVQQSYYGTVDDENYQPAVYMDNTWHYNPVQGGNQYNDNSKIVDVKIEENLIYIKCQPLDWAKEKEHITPSYMEAYYTIDGKMLDVSCRFVDFSGYEETVRTQELPAFYCVEPLNNFVYCDNGELKYVNNLIFWPDAGYPNYVSTENWAAFTGESEDSFGIGLYVPDEGATSFLTGVYARGETTNHSPADDSPTSYIAVVKDMVFKSYTPFEYDFYITTGDVTEIRNTFNTIKQ
ncbi:MAG: hypothetical protein IJZ35_04800 [Clostridia bacterium]|nr:hypothetical protein [Clostridia bacterium]